MTRRRIDPRLVQIHRSYTVNELAARLGIHKNTVRNWQREGLRPICGHFPLLFQGAEVREFVAASNAGRKRPCAPGELFCFRCRVPRRPALGMVDYIVLSPSTGNLRGLCEVCETFIYRRVRMDALGAVMPRTTVQIMEAQPNLSGRTTASDSCDLG